VAHSEKLGHFVVQKALAGTVRLDPLAVEDELRNGTFAYVADDLLGGAGNTLNINLGVGNLVLFKEAFGFPAIAAPGSGIDQHMHPLIISTAAA
jgi:hypothetical protein